MQNATLRTAAAKVALMPGLTVAGALANARPSREALQAAVNRLLALRPDALDLTGPAAGRVLALSLQGAA